MKSYCCSFGSGGWGGASKRVQRGLGLITQEGEHGVKISMPHRELHQTNFM